jgi:3-polyprenyl-4-hydroxybenzoate decarboxylase
MKFKKSTAGKKIPPSTVARAAKRIVADVRDFYLPDPERALISIKKRRDAEPRDLILGLLALKIGVKQIIVLDSDIDIRNASEVEAALTTRIQPKRDVIIIARAPVNASPTRAALGWGIDATAPLDPERSPARRSLNTAAEHYARALAAAALCFVLSACGANTNGRDELRSENEANGIWSISGDKTHANIRFAEVKK